MVQEVQKSIEIYNETTLDTIEAIGTSSRKIIEWRQTRGWHYVSWAVATGWVSWTYHSWDARQSDVIQWWMTLSSTSWKMEMDIFDWWLRVPQAWTYSINIYWQWWSTTMATTIYVYAGGKLIYTETHNSNTNDTVTVIADLGKFDLITVSGDFYYSGSATSASWSLSTTITVQQL